MTNRAAFPRHICIAFVVWLLASQPLRVLADEPALEFLDTGKPVQTLTRKDLAEKILPTRLTVENPSTSQAATYQGAALPALLTLVYGDRWKNAGLVKFVTRDGYQPVVPVTHISQHSGLMAYADAGQERLQLLGDGHGGTVDPGPFYLVWENIQDRAARKDPWLQWPWQLAKVELTSIEREYPQTAPPPGAPEAVMRGFNGFLSHCAKCHQINGEGGAIGPELNYPVNVTEYWQNDWLPKFIAHPQAIRHNSKMVGYQSSSPNPSAEIDDIVAYLRAMKDRKLAPSK